MNNDPFQNVLTLSGGLADRGRLRLTAALEAGELCVCQIVELLELAPSTVSKHIALLKSAGLIRTRKQGRWIYCSLNKEVSSVQSEALQWALAAVRDSSQGRRDRRMLARILKLPPEKLCRKQAARSKDCSSASIRDTGRA